MTVVRSGSATHVGRVRSVNQDLALEEGSLFAVADGMGGHVGGEVAARVAIDALRGAFGRQPSIDGLRVAVTEANTEVWRRGQADSELRGMGTTMTAVALVAGADGRDVVALANVGDSRGYVFSDGRIHQVTADHSLAEEKVRHGELTEAEAAVHPHRHILTRALGVAPDVDVDLWELHLRAGNRILLCSDGLTNEVSPPEIAGVLSSVADPVEAARTLVRAAVDHGGNDNVTVVIVDVLVGEPTDEDDAVAPDEPAVDDAPVATGAVAAAAAAAVTAGVGPEASAGAAPTAAPSVAAAGADDPVTGVVPAVPSTADREDDEGQDEEEDERPGWRERRRQRRTARRQAGIPRRLTFRVALFVVLLLVVLAAAYIVVRWYATDNWYVTVDNNHLVIYQGRPGGVLWFKPKVVERTSVTTAGVVKTRLRELAADVNEPSLAKAQRYVANLHQEYLTQRRISLGQVPGTSTTTFPTTPTTTTTTTTVPGATTTLPGATTTTTAVP